MGGGGRREWLFRRESPGEGSSTEWAALGAWKWEAFSSYEGSVVGKAAQEPKETKGLREEEGEGPGRRQGRLSRGGEGA